MTPNRAHALTVFFATTSPLSSPLFLRGGDGLADGTATLPGVQAALKDLGALLNDLGTLGKDELDVGGVGHVRVDLFMLGTFARFVSVYVHDREHGKCAFAAWEPG